MRFGFGRGTPAKERPLDPPPAPPSQQYDYPVRPDTLTWDLRRDGLTTQYKAFYFTFDDGSAGYMQIAYGNLGVLVKVCPMGFTYYRPGKEPIVLSSTLHASSMQLSDNDLSVKVGPHSITYKPHPTDPAGGVWHALIVVEGSLKYDLTFTTDFSTTGDTSEGGGALIVHDFGRDTPKEWVQHRLIPRLSVTGTVQAHGDATPVPVAGKALYIDAIFTHVKFTDLCNEFVNFQLRGVDGDGKEAFLMLLGYIPRAGDRIAGPRLAHGFYARDGKVEAVAFDGCVIDPAPLSSSSTPRSALSDEKTPPSTASTTRHVESGYDLPLANKFTWTGRPTTTTTSGGGGAVFKAEVTLTLPSQGPASVTDVMGIFPKFIKDIVSLWASPYVFCWHVPDTVAEVTVGTSDGGGEVKSKRSFTGFGLLELTNVHRSR